MLLTRVIAAAIVLLLTLSCPHPAHSSPTSDGWSLLFADKFVEARASFVKAVRANPADVDAYEGLVVLDREEDRTSDCINHALAIYRSDPGCAAVANTWTSFCTAIASSSRYPDLQAACNAILASPKSGANMRAAATLGLSEALERQGRIAEASKLRASLGFIRKWRVIGPFDNSSKSGFDKVFGPEKQIDISAKYDGKGDIAVEWHDLAQIDRYSIAHVGEALGTRAEEAYYAVTAVMSPTAQSGKLAFSPAGASKVFVNGKLVFSDSIFRPAGSSFLHSFKPAATLRAGWNTILVKLTDSDDYGASPEFRMRFETQSGQALALSADPRHAVTEASIANEPLQAPVTNLTSLNKTATGGASTRLWLATDYMETGDYPHCIDTVSDALKAYPKASIFRALSCLAYSSDDREDDAKAAAKAVYDANKRIVLMQIAYLASIDEQLTAAQKIERLNQALAVNPQSSMLVQLLASDYESSELPEESLKQSRRNARLDTGSAGAMALHGSLSGTGKTDEATKTLAAALVKYPNEIELLEFAATEASGRKNISAALGYYKRLAAVEPSSANYPSEMANLYYASGNLAQARLMWTRALSIQPQNTRTVVSLADIEREMGHKAAAMKLYREALRLDPTRVELRDKIDILSGGKPIIDLATAIDATKLLSKIPKEADYPKASAVILLDEQRRVVYPDGGTVIRCHEIVTVLTKAGVESFSTMNFDEDSSVPTTNVESARVIKADGSIQDVTTSCYGSSASYPSLAPGDTIDVTYRKTGRSSGELAGHFWDNWYFDVVGVPIKISRFVLITPTTTSYTVARHGAIPEATIKIVGTWKLAEWKLVDMPAIANEVQSPSIQDIGTWLDISSVPDWATIARWYTDLSGSRCVPDDAITAKALALTKDSKTESDKIKAIVGYVKSIPYQTSPFRMSAYVPTEGKKVMRDRYADCKDKAALLTAMLKAVGVTSQMVLLSGRDMGITPFLPSPRFNHAIACVQAANGPMFVDATADEMAYGCLPTADQDVPCLMINAKTSALSTTPKAPIDQDFVTERVKATIDEKGMLHEEYSLTALGSSSWVMRSVTAKIPESMLDQRLQRLASFMCAATIYDSGAIEGIKDIDAPLVVNLVAHKANYASNAGDFMMVKIPWSTREGEDPRIRISDKDRKYDLEMPYGNHTSVSEMTLTMPSGYELQNPPANVTKTTPYGSAEFVYHLNGNVLKVSIKETSSKYRIPKSELAAYLDFRSEVAQEYSRTLVLKKVSVATK
ncbi:MAG TPA: DUF3857 domain-containing protein [Capsulimonadaceae bacterium]|jgi:tetratricopeptide (TPR) repeat protein